MNDFEFFNKVKDKILPEHKNSFELAEKILLGSCLFGTILTDAYSLSQTREIYESLKKLCGKFDEKPFDTFGIYCYWDFETKEILYIGLSKNLINRFSQHNNLRSKKGKGNKSLRIKDYFNKREKLGFSILLQPPIIIEEEYIFDKDREIKVIEGAIFQSFIDQYNRLPIWNANKGDKVGRKLAIVKRYGDILMMLNLKAPGYLNAKSTIRELADNIEYQSLECDLNLIRSHMYQWKEPFEEVVIKIINFNNFLVSEGNISAISSNIRLVKLLEDSYLKKVMKAL